MEELIYKHLVELENKRKIYSNKYNEYEIDQVKLNNAINDIESILSFKLSKGKCSKLLIEQIARHKLNILEKFINNLELYNASEILEIIGLLENDKIKHTDFKGDILNGYSKIHHNTYGSLGHSIVRNMREYWFHYGKIKKKRQKDFQQIISLYEKHGLAVIMRAMHSKAMKNKELKGEWIIFKKYQGINYYLCLATHYENDKTIFNEKIMRCQSEFPELISN